MLKLSKNFYRHGASRGLSVTAELFVHIALYENSSVDISLTSALLVDSDYAGNLAKRRPRDFSIISISIVRRFDLTRRMLRIDIKAEFPIASHIPQSCPWVGSTRGLG